VPLPILLALLFQFPANENLSADGSKEFRNEIHRIEQLLETANDKPTVLYALARTWAAGGRYREAMDTLLKVEALHVGLDPVNDKIFDKLRRAPEFQDLLERVHAGTPPIIHSRLSFIIYERGFAPEGIAQANRRYYIGSTTQHRILECTPVGKCHTFAGQGLAGVLGLKIHNGNLWAASGGDIFRYDISTGKLIHKYPGGQVFNDLAINQQGDVFITDTKAATVYWIDHRTDRLQPLNPALKIEGPNGIALSDDGRKLYVAGFPDGLTVIDLPSGKFRPVAHPADLCLATIDGLAFYKNTLIAIQNGVMTHRVVRYYLTPNLNAIDRFEILERRNPLFDGPTTGTIANGAFYYMANTNDDPIRILRLTLSP
jgi:SMP-30/gluconolaconase/LRE-like protein